MVVRYLPELGEDCEVKMVDVGAFHDGIDEVLYVTLEDYINDADQMEEQIWDLNDKADDMAYEFIQKNEVIASLEKERDELQAKVAELEEELEEAEKRIQYHLDRE